MRRECYVSQPLEVETYAVRGGTDIIMRKDIEQTTKETDGETATVWECYEKQIRIRSDVTAEEVGQNFDYYWTLADGGNKETAEPTLDERIAAIEEAILEIAEVISNG